VSDKKIIAVVGATGAQGGGLVRAIVADRSGQFVARAITRNTGSDKAKELAALGDVHQGNGTASILAGDKRVFTLSIQQGNNYPAEKPPSDIDINLPDETGDEEYIDRLRGALVPAITMHRPQIIAFVAGADPYYRDQLGGLALTVDGIRARDRMVFASALMQRIPVFVVLAGGYAVELKETVTIHANTARAAKEVLDRVSWRR
jgi:acetoin utilization deacetylase AcuC-like enzyme